METVRHLVHHRRRFEAQYALRPALGDAHTRPTGHACCSNVGGGLALADVARGVTCQPQGGGSAAARLSAAALAEKSDCAWPEAYVQDASIEDDAALS